MTVVDMFAGMSRGRRPGSRSVWRRVPEEEHAEAAEVYRESVARLQATAYRNLRQSIAFGTIIWAVLIALMIVTGEVTAARLPWYSASIVGGALGLCTYAVREPRVRLYVLSVAVVFTVAGLVGVLLVN
ncbi:hypothetical protein [Micromonospora sp. NPDC047187]|uniref:hypothetical protein n=1 Tax=Micromonospora sp. NPDC047187 TaxID=3155262 RepID=UPI00340D8DDD